MKLGPGHPKMNTIVKPIRVHEGENPMIGEPVATFERGGFGLRALFGFPESQTWVPTSKTTRPFIPVFDFDSDPGRKVDLSCLVSLGNHAELPGERGGRSLGG